MPAISFSSRKGEAGKMAAATPSGLAERAPRRERNTRFNLKLGADILVPFSTLGRRPSVPLGALLGRVHNEVGV